MDDNTHPSPYCILVAEDDALIRFSTVRTLSKAGYCTIEAVNGVEALRLAAEYDGAVHVMVTNVDMPEMDGHELSRRMKEARPDILTLVVSAQHERDFPPEAKHYADALLKPLQGPQLLKAVQKLLRKSDELRRNKPA